jgi:hypothetical protein
MGENALAVFGGEVHHLDLDAERVGDAHHVDQILARRTILVGIVVFPVLHEQADHVPALLLEQQAATAESTPPDRPTTTVFPLFIFVSLLTFDLTAIAARPATSEAAHSLPGLPSSQSGSAITTAG